VEAPVLLQVDAPLQAPTAWDALAFARLDAVADAAHRELRRPWADGAERLVARARDVRAPGASRRRLELRAALAEVPIELEPCRLDAAQFAERSCAEREAPEQTDAPQGAPLAERSPKPPEELRLNNSVPQAVTRGVAACSSAAVPEGRMLPGM
jgi:hypothetical protein